MPVCAKCNGRMIGAGAMCEVCYDVFICQACVIGTSYMDPDTGALQEREIVCPDCMNKCSFCGASGTDDEVCVCLVCELDYICDRCVEAGTVVRIESGQLRREPKCIKCYRLMCKGCMKVCYDCCNKGMEPDFLCVECAPVSMKSANCTIHKRQS
jgi:hypothetical protein